MFDEADREAGFALAIAIALAIFVSIFTIGIAAGSAVGQIGRKPAATASATMSAGAAPAARMSTVKLYFELGKADLPADALTRLAPLIRSAQESQSALVVSGYHDASGDAAANADLAKQRAFAVRDLLATAGVSERNIQLATPAVTTGGDDPREARRVDVTVR